MNSNEFVFWLKGIVDSTDFMPTKKMSLWKVKVFSMEMYG